VHEVILVFGLLISLLIEAAVLRWIARSSRPWRGQAAWLVGIVVSFVLAFMTAAVAGGPDWYFLVVDIPLLVLVAGVAIKVAVDVGKERRTRRPG
jgi:4-amino-4-deoxy-L-arabinose transferase-like glycosyltransferase